ncbi:hypothetical protein [Odoribacter sp. Z80]|uniref:hypothetical protein n=1 Tax=Odoribacter sp. Z80 TaxID=2304575 RepID=UPI00137B1187|nr:hypothetical protein [Odoribacter sp. Z80]NCE71882.1 hypothetical protein [Odoribacter sp. Z80]
MENKKQKNDDKEGIRGVAYQCLVAVKYALELEHFNLLTIEHEGDVTFDSKLQIEVKHHADKPSMGDKHEDFWKTLYNWCTQGKEYEQLILYTTSHPSSRGSLLRDWNTLSIDRRLYALKKVDFNYNLDSIHEYCLSAINLSILENFNLDKQTLVLLKSYKNKVFSKDALLKILRENPISEEEQAVVLRECKNTNTEAYRCYNYSRFVLSLEKEKLRSVVSKIQIKWNQPIDEELVNELATSNRLRIIPCQSGNEYRKLIKEKLVGFIVSKVMGEDRWEVKDKQFYATIQEIGKDYFQKNYDPLFDEYLNKKPGPADYTLSEEKKFLAELRQIECDEDEVTDALIDYWKTNTLLAEEDEKNPAFFNFEYKPYKNEVMHPKLINKKRSMLNKRMDKNENALHFYRDAKCMSVPPFKSIPDYPYFIHGTMQNIVEDDELNFSWLYE